MPAATNIILASSSVYRQAMLMRLKIRFRAVSPAIDETPLSGEPPEKLVQRLSAAKAEKVAKSEANAIIIGSDQVAVLAGEILTKPGNRDNAWQQLHLMRGKSVEFLTGLCVLNSSNNQQLTDCVRYQVMFRDYSDGEIERYLEIETPFDCAGSFKSEQLGISLVAKMSGDDPTALIGLPLIRLSQMLRQQGLNIP